MSGALNMSLDDIIKSSKKTAGGGRGRGRDAGGPSRRVPNRTANRSAPYSSGKAPNSVWQHDMYSTTQAGGFPAPTTRASSIDTGTKLYISNLEFGVSNEDIKFFGYLEPKEEEEAALWSEANGVRHATFRTSMASLS
ncbi:THO complex subunit 4A-like [Zingiber officinale]|uniref:THO complex subunit 4A-like n=1 Tax=Zingiber officinale TaxID=94328 RepID=UPI001C4B9151|nr:THO complex subunit 4A-like [Zingiber officinale]